VTALVAVVAASPRELWLAFDVAVMVPPPSAIAIMALSIPAVPLQPLILRGEELRLVVELDTDMTPGAGYEVLVTGLVDRLGNPVSPPHDRARFVGFAPPRPAARRFDLLSMLPRYLRRADVTGDLQRFIAVLQEVADLVLGDVDRWTEILDLERAPEAFLDAMLADLGNPFELELDVVRKRRLVARLVDMYRRKGTAAGVEDAIRFFVGVDSRVVAFAGEGLTLGDSLLGVDWVLGPSTQWGRYAFDVEVARVLTAEERRHVRGLVSYLRPAHTHFSSLVEPTPTPTPLLWELGVSEIGLASTRLG
jgi:phage tail-like protein